MSDSEAGGYLVTKDEVLQVLRKVYDPEIPVSIVDLGLIYGVDVDDDGNVKIRMTLTTPGCPMGFFLTQLVKEVVKKEVRGVKSVDVEIVWDPPWTPDRMSEEAKRKLGFA